MDDGPKNLSYLHVKIATKEKHLAIARSLKGRVSQHLVIHRLYSYTIGVPMGDQNLSSTPSSVYFLAQWFNGDAMPRLSMTPECAGLAQQPMCGGQVFGSPFCQ